MCKGLRLPQPFISIAALVFLAAFHRPAGAVFDPELESDQPPQAAAPEPAIPEGPPAPHVEAGPMSLEQYEASGRTPSYVRLNVKGYNVRTSPDFSEETSDNIAFRSQGGDLLAVEAMHRLERGVALQVRVDGEERWLYVPRSRQDDFQLCESAACFSAMADSLDFLLRGSGITHGQAFECGVRAGPGGLILPAAAPAPRKEPAPRMGRREAAAPALRLKPLWELERGRTEWTAMLAESLERHGGRLLEQRSLNDAAEFCPRFSSLSRDEKKEFFIHLFSGIAKKESDFKPGLPAFQEPLYRDRRLIEKGKYVFRGPINKKRFSMGLFQLSYVDADSRRYRPACSGLDWRRDSGKRVEDRDLTIYDPKIQMDCAVTIMNHWVPKTGGIGGDSNNGGANYWSTLRDSNPASQEIKSRLRAYTPCWRKA